MRKIPNKKCKDCYGSGKLLRTAPILGANLNYRKRKNTPEKEMIRIGTPCHCLKPENEEGENGG